MRNRSFLFQAVVWSLISNAMFAIMWVFIKLLGNRIPTGEAVLLRGITSLLCLVPILHWKKVRWKFGQVSTLLVRAFCGYLGMLCGFYALPRMGMGNVSALSNTSPIFVALLAPLFGRERFEKRHFALVLLAFAGVCLIVKPDRNIVSSVAWLALSCGLLNAISLISVRDLYRSNNAYTITFFFTLTITLFALPMGLWNFILPTAREAILLTLIGVTGSFAQLWLMKAYQHIATSIMSSVGYVFVLFCYALEILIWHTLPDALTMIGALVVIGSGIGILQLQQRKSLAGASNEATTKVV